MKIPTHVPAGEELMPADTPLAKRTILCVQPNEAFHAALRAALSEYHLVIAHNGFEAVRAHNAAPFDAYVIDYWLPDWTGVSLCRQIRRTEPNAPLCFFTAREGDEQKRRALRAGANAYLLVSNGAEALASRVITLIQIADLRALQARGQTEVVLQEELQRRAASLEGQDALARFTEPIIERAIKASARKAFIAAAGSNATFERWWPQLFESALATFRATAGSPPPAR